MATEQKRKGKCEQCGKEPRVVTQIDSGQWCCRLCRAAIKRFLKESYADAKTIESLRNDGFQVSDTLDRDEAERLKWLSILRWKGGNAHLDEPINSIKKMVYILELTKRNFKLSGSETFEELEDLRNNKRIKHYCMAVAGESHQNRDGSDRQGIIGRCKVGDNVRLHHEPDNPYDKNAVCVATMDGEQIGYIPADYAPEFVAKFKADHVFSPIIITIGRSVEMFSPLGVVLLVLEGKPGVTGP